ncbi:hypothetical protein SAMCFNEI73_pC1669 (plasmid) [Sinorhizobium americanum]|uniref:Uncharacterized protein n=1 Tax=Sinorhizobium americanum TaxID=194963 RepID=A0A1L3LZC6_9HYPH|nr:hypothetical protein SAMCFNEI73_pC1669 [Sinorhizobium americanum]
MLPFGRVSRQASPRQECRLGCLNATAIRSDELHFGDQVPESCYTLVDVTAQP